MKKYVAKIWAWLKIKIQELTLEKLMIAVLILALILAVGIPLLSFGYLAWNDIIDILSTGKGFLTYVGPFLLASVSLYLLYRRAEAQDRLAKAQQQTADNQLKQAEAQQQTVKNQLTAEANARFGRAIEQIGDSKEAKDNEGNLLPNIEVRLGGLYTLEQLAKEQPETYHNTILSVLCAYVRENAPKIDTSTTEQTNEKPREDIQTTLTIIGRRGVRKISLPEIHNREPQINLSQLILTGANLQAANLEGAKLQKAKLQEANLQEANLQRANLEGAKLQEAKLLGTGLHRADLQQANLQQADLQYAQSQQANLQEADLREANLEGTQLQEADLQKAQLQGANLYEANLQQANLQEAKLQGANLEEADLQGANLQGADLQGASLRWANLKSSNLSKEQLQSVYVDKNTTFPDGKKYAHEELERIWA